MGKDKLDDFIKRETQGLPLGETITEAALAGILKGAAKALGCFFNRKT